MNRRINPFLVFIIPLIFLTEPAFSQCCSTGSPVGASVYVGVLNKNSLRTVAYYRHSYSDTYYEGNNKTEENPALEYARYNFTGIGLGYGVTKRLTLEVDFGYFFDKTQQHNETFSAADTIYHGKEQGYGLSNGGVTAKYGVFVKPIQQLEITIGAGFRYPFTMSPQVRISPGGTESISRDVQPSTNAFGASGMFFFNKGFPSITLRVFSINRYDYNFEGKGNDVYHSYKYGNILLNSVFVSKKLFKYCFGILQLRSEWKTNDKDITADSKVLNSGFWLLTLSPSLSYSIAGKWNLTAIYDIPLYKNYNGKQMTPKYSFALSLSHDFNLGHKVKGINEQQ